MSSGEIDQVTPLSPLSAIMRIAKSFAIFAWMAFLALPLLVKYGTSEMAALAACFVLKAIDWRKTEKEPCARGQRTSKIKKREKNICKRTGGSKLGRLRKPGCISFDLHSLKLRAPFTRLSAGRALEILVHTLACQCSTSLGQSGVCLRKRL